VAFRLDCQGKTVRENDNMTGSIQDISLQPIGVVRSAFLRREETPKQGRETSARADLEIFPAFRAGLQGLAELKHAFILTWLHQASRDMLMVHPRGDQDRPKQGVFSTRSPHRPNPIGLNMVRIISISDSGLTVEGLEAIDGTPILDIKPFVPKLDTP
jgi:tRNA-Thr(GGU) m(6)t(6)A37 methyltransferase TsaA